MQFETILTSKYCQIFYLSQSFMFEKTNSTKVWHGVKIFLSGQAPQQPYNIDTFLENLASNEKQIAYLKKKIQLDSQHYDATESRL